MPTLYELKVDFAMLSKEYPGRWVAVHPDTGAVLCDGASPKEVLQAMTSIPVADPIILKVEDHYGAFVT